MKTKEQFLEECDERVKLMESLVALKESKGEQLMLEMAKDIGEYVGLKDAIQFEMSEDGFRINEVTAQVENGDWINLEGSDKYFYFENYIGVKGELNKLTCEFEKLIIKYTEQKSALVDTNHHDHIYYDLQGYEETFFEALEDQDVKWLEELVRDLKKQTKAFDNVIKGLNEVSYTFC